MENYSRTQNTNLMISAKQYKNQNEKFNRDLKKNKHKKETKQKFWS